MQEIKVLLWNVHWQRAGTPGGMAIRRTIAEHQPDLICLAEANVDLLGPDNRITSSADFGGPSKEGRRKVVLWSRWPWQEVDSLGDEILPAGRFVRGRLLVPGGPIDVLGVCIPWDGAHVKMGRKDARPWQEHARYLDGLKCILGRSKDHARTIILGDFNQAIPRTRAPRAIHERLIDVFQPSLDVATEGLIDGLRSPAIDHLTHGAGIRVHSVRALPNVNEQGRRISDHVGLFIVLSA